MGVKIGRLRLWCGMDSCDFEQQLQAGDFLTNPETTGVSVGFTAP